MASSVAIVRESYVSKSELCCYESIPRYEVSLVASRGHSYQDLPASYLFSPASASKPFVKHALQATASTIFGSSTYMYGLTDRLSDYDIVHTVETFHGFTEQAIHAKKRHGCRVVCTVWENIPYFVEDSHYSRTWRERIKHPNAAAIKKQAREHVDAFLPVTEQAAEALRIEGVEDDRIHVVPIGVDSERFQPGMLDAANRSPEEFGLSGDSTLDVVFVGRYTYSKGVYDLLSAWKRVVKQTNQPVHLTLIGGGDERNRVEKYAKYANVPNVTIMGQIPYSDVPLVFDGADIAVLPSIPTRHWQEQYGRVILEAQAAGTPVAASDTGGIPDALGGVGELFQPGEPLDISNTLLSLIQDGAERRRLSEEGRKRIKNSRSVEQTREAVKQVYDSVIQ